MLSGIKCLLHLKALLGRTFKCGGMVGEEQPQHLIGIPAVCCSLHNVSLLKTRARVTELKNCRSYIVDLVSCVATV